MIKQADMRVELPIVLDASEDDPPEMAAAKAFLTGGKLAICSAPREALLTAGTVVSFEVKAADAPTQGYQPDWRRFDRSDWDGLAGATPFRDGSAPYVADNLVIDGHAAVAVLDAEGLTLLVLDDDGMGYQLYLPAFCRGVPPVALPEEVSVSAMLRAGALVDDFCC